MTKEWTNNEDGRITLEIGYTGNYLVLTPSDIYDDTRYYKAQFIVNSILCTKKYKQKNRLAKGMLIEWCEKMVGDIQCQIDYMKEKE